MPEDTEAVNDLDGYEAFTRNLVFKAGEKAKESFRGAIHSWLKHNKSLVTEVDMAVQKMLQSAIAKAYPDHDFLGEEETDSQASHKTESTDKYLWVADPIDGTNSFATGLPVWGVSLALLKNGESIAAAFYQPATGELYHAKKGGPALLTLYQNSDSLDSNNQDQDTREIKVNPDNKLNGRSLFLTTSNFHLHFDSAFTGKQRTLGSLAAHQCIVARGGAVAAIMRPNIWDIAASSLVLKQAGGLMLDLETEQEVNLADYANHDGRHLPLLLAVSSPEIFGQIKKLISPR